MKTRTEKWLYGLGAACIGGGASAVTSGLASIGIDPEKFNINTLGGFGHVMEMVILNFLLSGFLAGMFYLRQSPLPPEGDTQIIVKPQ